VNPLGLLIRRILIPNPIARESQRSTRLPTLSLSSARVSSAAQIDKRPSGWKPEGLLILVGARGFEPPTTCTPCRYATRLRYAPKESESISDRFRTENPSDDFRAEAAHYRPPIRRSSGERTRIQNHQADNSDCVYSDVWIRTGPAPRLRRCRKRTASTTPTMQGIAYPTTRSPSAGIDARLT
jgi:hypothetical protein